MKCSEVRDFLSDISFLKEPITPIPPNDLGFLSSNGYVQSTSADDYQKVAADVARMSQLADQIAAEKPAYDEASMALWRDKEKEHSFSFIFAAKDEKEAVRERMDYETSAAATETAKLNTLETNMNALIQVKSWKDRMVAYDGIYLSMTGLGTLVLNDLDVRNYRVADEEFPDFLNEIKATYAELRSIADRAAYYVSQLLPKVPHVDDAEGGDRTLPVVWSTAIGLGKLGADPVQVVQRALKAVYFLRSFGSTPPNELMAAEVMTALLGQDIDTLYQNLNDLERVLKKNHVPKQLSAGVAATILAGRRYDGSYPVDNFDQYRKLTSSLEAAAVLAVMNVPYADLSAKFQSFRTVFDSWGYMKSEDTEIASAFMAIGELDVDEVQDKLKYVVEQLRNYLEYPLVAAAILASIPVFEAHEVLDLMEKAVTLLTNYVGTLERSEIVALAVRMIHGVRNEVVKEIDPTAKTAETPVQFTYGVYPGLYRWYFPVIVSHSSYNATFSGMGGFHPAHSHGIGGFAG